MSRPGSGIAPLPGSSPHCPFLPATRRGWIFLHSYPLSILLRKLMVLFTPSRSGQDMLVLSQGNDWYLCPPPKKYYQSSPDFERSAYKVVPWLVSENLIFRRVPTIPRSDKDGSLCLTVDTVWFPLNTCFHS